MATRVFFMKFGARRHVRTPKIMLNPCRVIQKHTFRLIAKSCFREGPRPSFWMVFGLQNLKKTKKCHRERNQKNDFVSGAHKHPPSPPSPGGPGGRGGQAILLFGPGQGVPGLRRRDSLYKPRPNMLKKPLSTQA